MHSWAVLLAFCGFSLVAKAEFPVSGLVDGLNSEPQRLETILERVRPGSIVVIGENHGLGRDQEQQLQIMQGLRDRGLTVAVGLEFLEYPRQADVEAYRRNELTEAEFLKRARWGSISYDFYRNQALFPRLEEGAHTVALNIPHEVTSQVAKAGVESLSAELQAWMPPDFTLGRNSYRERFLATIPHLPNPQAADFYFAAQSTWDETMAWQATRYMETHPDQVLVVVIGEFHVQYGGGFPDRLRARGSFPVLTFSQVETEGLTAEERAEEVKPSPVYGPRADYVWFQ